MGLTNHYQIRECEWMVGTEAKVYAALARQC